MRVLNQLTTAYDEEDGRNVVGRLVVEDDGTVKFQARDVEDRPEEKAAAPEGSRPDTEEVGTPEA